jgi:DNA-binding protein H-NS
MEIIRTSLLFNRMAYTPDSSREYFFEKELHVSERQNGKVIEWLEISLDKLTNTDRIGLINEVMDTLSAQDLRVIRDTADKKRQAKLKVAQATVIAEMREKFGQLDLSFEEVLAAEGNKKTKRGSGASAPVKYRSPDGETWSGRGRAPVWLRNLETEGHNRQEYLVQAEE